MRVDEKSSATVENVVRGPGGISLGFTSSKISFSLLNNTDEQCQRRQTQ